MFTTIIIGVDGRSQDAEAIALATCLGEPGAELILASVAVIEDPLLGTIPPRSSGRLLDQAQDLVDSVAEGQASTETVVTSAPSVGVGLSLLAQSSGADLIVVASSRRGALGRVFAGDAVKDVLRHAPCPVAVATVGAASVAPLKRITVGYDASPEAEAALAQALDLGGRDGASVGVVAVVEPAVAVASSMTGAYVTGGFDERYAKARSDLDRVAARHDLHGVVAVGSAAHELADASRGSDLIAVGLHHYGLLDRLLEGSTAYALLRLQSAPMLITPPRMIPPSVADALDEAPASRPTG